MLRDLVARKLLPFVIKPLFAKENDLSSFPPKWLFRKAFSSDIESAFRDKVNESLTVSYLIDSCGLRPKSALSAAKGVSLKSTRNADSVLQLFREYGFSDDHITKTMAKYPVLLSFKLETNLKPKLEFLFSAGFKSDELGSILMANPFLLRRSLHNVIVPTVLFLKSNIQSMSRIVRVLKNAWSLPLKIELLRGEGLPDSVIMRIVTYQPRTLNQSTDRLRDVVNSVKEMGIDSKSKMFGITVAVLSNLSKSTWLRKMEFYRGLGWSDEEISSILCKQPFCLGLSEETILKKLEFFRESMGWDHTVLVKYPVLIQYSLEKRIIPRVSVLNILASRGLIPKSWGKTKLMMSNKCFFNSHVQMYQDTIPELRDVYHPALQV